MAAASVGPPAMLTGVTGTNGFLRPVRQPPDRRRRPASPWPDAVVDRTLVGCFRRRFHFDRLGRLRGGGTGGCVVGLSGFSGCDAAAGCADSFALAGPTISQTTG